MAVLVESGSVDVIYEDWGSLQWLVTGKNGSSKVMTLGRVVIKPGMANPHHSHPNCEEILYVASGTILHSLPDGGAAQMKAGDAIVVPQGIFHHARNTGETDAVLIVTFNNAWRETIGEG